MTKLLRIAAFAAGLAPAALFGQPFQQESWLTVPGNDGGFRRLPLPGQSGPVTGRPLSADEVRHTVQVLSDGTRIEKSETDRFYRDSEGRMRTETPTGAVIYDPVAGYTYDVSNSSKTYTKSPLVPGATTTIAAQSNQSSVSSRSHSGNRPAKKQDDAAWSEELTPQTMSGFLASGVRITVTIPAGAIGNDRDLKSVTERWFSDDLKLLLKSSSSDPRFGATTYELTNISQALPDPSLFQPPADYKPGVNPFSNQPRQDR